MNNPSGSFYSPTDQAPLERENLPFQFTGTGSEYFRIWTVNLFLSIVTLGIYSAWAKVRRTRYFYGSTRVADASFDYHGNPVAILKGRIIALVGIVLYNVAIDMSNLLGVLLLVALACLMPWMLWKSLQFRLHNSSYRGLRFSFGGTLRQAYTVFLFWPVVTAFTAYLLAPLAHQRLKKFQHENSRYGASEFGFHAGPGKFYKVYLIAGAIILAGLVVLATGIVPLAAGMKTATAAEARAKGVVIGLYVMGIIVWLMMVFPIFLAMIQNLIWNHTRLGDHAFKADIRLGRMIFLTITNIVGIVLTLGLFTPFAVIRTMKYKVQATTLIAVGSLDEFVALASTETSATGEGAADLLDFDLSL